MFELFRDEIGGPLLALIVHADDDQISTLEIAADCSGLKLPQAWKMKKKLDYFAQKCFGKPGKGTCLKLHPGENHGP